MRRDLSEEIFVGKMPLLIALLFLSSCQFFKGTPPPREQADLLSQEYAELRKKNISQVNYHLKFDLTNPDQYSGIAQVQFELKELFYLTLDFAKGQVQSLLVNGHKINEIAYNGFYIEIPEDLLQKGPNKITIAYTHEYSKNGMGLYKYQDVETQKVYLYSNFEPYKANRLFPSFDQPNLKATYVTEVKAPSLWHVISSNRETEKVEEGSFNLWKFPMTPRFSTYTYSLHAGEFAMWESVAKTKNHEIPLRLFARQSLSQYVKPEVWFNLTQKGLSFFEKYFSYPYPYQKYDQLLVPDFNSSAMENIGAVTFNEDRFIAKGEKSRGQKRRLASVLYHEMAHMWFGNLVTMDWWNDLWLNESFATYSATVGLSESTEFNEAWSAFNNYAKQSAYRADLSVNTHPIALEVNSTDKAFSNFDAITYGKGASVLKQMAFYLGDKTYRQGLKDYFSTHAHKNTRLADFMASMEKSSGRDLKQWEQRWLKTARLNDIEVHFTCKKGRINNFEIYQTASKEYPMLRSHKTKVALFRKWRGVFKLNRQKSVEYSGERTFVKSMVGQLCPDIVYPNYKDHDYVTVTLDKKSLKNIESSLSTIDDPFLRGILWTDLWQMVLNNKMDMERYLEVVEFNGLVEKNRENLGKVLTNINTILGEYYPRGSEDWEKKRKVWVKFFEQASLTKLQETMKEPEIQKLWFNFMVSVSESPEIHKQWVRLLKGQTTLFLLTFHLDQDMRWDLLVPLMSYGHEEAEKLLSLEEKKDSSKRGQLNGAYIASLKPDAQAKEKLFNEVIKNKENKSLGYLRTVMAGLFPSNQKNIQRLFEDRYYEVLKTIHQTSDKLFVRNFMSRLAPQFCDELSSQKMEDFMQAEKSLSFPFVKTLKGLIFENDRCTSMRRVLKENSQKTQQPLEPN